MNTLARSIARIHPASITILIFIVFFLQLYAIANSLLSIYMAGLLSVSIFIICFWAWGIFMSCIISNIRKHSIIQIVFFVAPAATVISGIMQFPTQNSPIGVVIIGFMFASAWLAGNALENKLSNSQETGLTRKLTTAALIYFGFVGAWFLRSRIAEATNT